MTLKRHGATIALATIFTCLPTASHAADWKIPAGMKSMEINHYPLAYFEDGDPSLPTVIMVHGANVDARYFKAQTPLAEKYHLIRLSLRNYWPEPYRGKTPFSSYQQVLDVIDFIQALKVGPVHLMGHSRGGGIVTQVALRRPDLIRTLTLMEPASSAAGLFQNRVPDEPENTGRADAAKIRALLEQGKGMDAAEAVTDPKTWVARDQAWRQELVDNIWTSAVTPITTPSVAATCDTIHNTLTMPVLFIVGEEGTVDQKIRAGAWQACLQNEKFVIVPHAPHGMVQVNPEFSNKTFLEFLGRN